jgi:hypothetical protein
MAAGALAELPVQLADGLGQTEIGAPLLSLIVHVDLAKLQLTERDGCDLQKLRSLGALVNAQGEMVAAKEVVHGR